MKVRLHVEASAELEAAAAWYDAEQEGLGEELLDELARGLSTICASPTAWPIVRRSTNLRRFVLARFPYVIVYASTEDELRVYAVAHQKRRPGYWRKRRF